MRLAPNDPGRARLLPFVLAPVMLVAGCNSGIPDDLEGLACDADGRCADGFVCDRKTNRCVRGLPESDASGANERGNAPLEPSPSVPEECVEGEVDCASGCALLDRDPETCGGCGARCTGSRFASAAPAALRVRTGSRLVARPVRICSRTRETAARAAPRARSPTGVESAATAGSAGSHATPRRWRATAPAWTRRRIRATAANARTRAPTAKCARTANASARVPGA